MSRTAAVAAGQRGTSVVVPGHLVVEHPMASGTGPVVLEMTLPADARQLPPPTGGPGLEDPSRALAQHDLTVAGSSLSNEEAPAFLAEHS